MVVVKEERWMDKVTVTARSLSYQQPAVASTPPCRSMTMTATRAIVAPLIDASLTPPTAAHTPRTQKETGGEEWRR